MGVVWSRKAFHSKRSQGKLSAINLSPTVTKKMVVGVNETDHMQMQVAPNRRSTGSHGCTAVHVIGLCSFLKLFCSTTPQGIRSVLLLRLGYKP